MMLGFIKALPLVIRFAWGPCGSLKWSRKRFTQNMQLIRKCLGKQMFRDIEARDISHMFIASVYGSAMNERVHGKNGTYLKQVHSPIILPMTMGRYPQRTVKIYQKSNEPMANLSDPAFVQ